MDGDYDISHAFAFQEKFPADDANAQKRRAATRPFVPPYFFAAFLAAFAAFFAGALTAFFAAFLAVAMFAPWKHPELESAGVQPEDASFRWLNFVATNMHLRVVTKFFLARDSSLAQNSVTNILNDYKGLQSTAIFPGRLRDAVPHPFRLAGGTRGECRRPGGSASQSKLPGGAGGGMHSPRLVLAGACLRYCAVAEEWDEFRKRCIWRYRCSIGRAIERVERPIETADESSTDVKATRVGPD